MSTAPSATADFLPLPPAREIPATFLASAKSWWAVGQRQSAASEERLLRRLPFFRPAGSSTSPSVGQVATIAEVPLRTPKHYINTLSIKSRVEPVPDGVAPPVVLLHGYGAGLGFFYLNFPGLAKWAQKRQTNMYALDWLGMGRSARVPFVVKAKRNDISGRVKEAEDFFVDALEEWRETMKLEKMTLIGHSLGAYLSVVYALRYPTRVHKLILLSPAGVPHDPYNTEVPSREMTDAQVSGNGGEPQPATKGEVENVKDEQRARKREETVGRRVLTYLWEEGFSPFQIARSSLFWGPMLVGKYSSRRFAALKEEDVRDLNDYILNITLAKGSGEYCISHILAPGAHARMPLVDRVEALKIPVTFVYGDQDWMDPAGGLKSVDNMREAGNGQGRMYIVPNAGHHVYLDNVKATNELIIKELDRPVEDLVK